MLGLAKKRGITNAPEKGVGYQGGRITSPVKIAPQLKLSSHSDFDQLNPVFDNSMTDLKHYQRNNQSILTTTKNLFHV